jgi:hypothetical protein
MSCVIFIIIWHYHLALSFGIIIWHYHLVAIDAMFLRVLVSFLPLRYCNCAFPLHDMPKYFNPFFPNTLVVQSEIAF